jgi:hypothetical protein
MVVTGSPRVDQGFLRWCYRIDGAPISFRGGSLPKIELATEIKWQDRLSEAPMERIYLSEQLGYDVFLAAEGRGSECFIPLGYVAARTKVIDLGSRRSTT